MYSPLSSLANSRIVGIGIPVILSGQSSIVEGIASQVGQV
jgi:hypothetical protein